jgi:hypothetical protein
VYNYIYNVAVLKSLPDNEKLLEVFHDLVTIINATAFPAGVAIGVWLTTRVVTTVKTVQKLRGGPKDDTFAMRRACLRLGEHAAIVSVTLWFVCGLIYPVVLDQRVGIPWDIYALFIGSLTICGLIASAYPFFMLTYATVHGLYPVFVQCGVCDERDAAELRRLGHRLKLYFVGAGLVPLLAVLGVILSSLGRERTNTEEMTMLVVCIGGMAALVATGWFYKQLETHLTALARVVSGRGIAEQDPDARRSGSLVLAPDHHSPDTLSHHAHRRHRRRRPARPRTRCPLCAGGRDPADAPRNRDHRCAVDRRCARRQAGADGHQRRGL